MQEATINQPNETRDNGLEKFFESELDALKAKNLYRLLRVVTGAQGARAVINGRDVINLSSNNYLGLANHPKLKAAAIAAIEKYGAGAGAVRTIIGTLDIHQELECKLAGFKHTPGTLVFQSGFTANSGTLSAVMVEGDLIISDELNHASIIDGIRLSKAERKVFVHKDMDSLEKVLRENAGKYGKMLVVTDGVFSMDGDIAPLPGIVELAERWGAAVMVDDAHASGVLGQNGRGSTDHFGLQGRVAIQVGTLSKAVGVMGGYVAGSLALRDYLIHRARPFLFSTAHPPAVVGAIIAAIELMQNDDILFQQLWDNTHYFKGELNKLGFNTLKSETPITPVIAGEAALAVKLSDRLFEEGVFAQSIGYPTVAEGKARVRTIVTAAHTRQDLEEAVAAFAKVGRAIGLI